MPNYESDKYTDPYWEPKTVDSRQTDTTAPHGPVGWVCPVCGCGNSPYAMYCRCNAPPMKITCNIQDYLA